MIGFLKGYMSNWYKAPFTIKDQTFINVEQYMMYQKAITFKDMETAEKILKSTNSREIKDLGRQVKNYNDTVWNGLRQLVVYDAIMAKFSQNEDIKKQLLETGDEMLVECNGEDSIWAIYMYEDNPDIQDISKWKGQNLLGFTLMRVRDNLK